MARRREASIAGRVFALQALATALVAGVLLVVLVFDARREADADAATTSLAIARTIATDPAVREAVTSADPTARLQPYTDELLTTTAVDFVTIMNPDGIRFTHPDPDRIGQRFLGTISAAQRGRELTETYTGTLGPSVRAVVPIQRGGAVIAIVAVGITTARVSAAILPRIPFVLGIAVAIVVAGALGAYLLQRGIRRVTGGLPPAELTRRLGYYESVLHSVREGLVLTDDEHRVVLYNDEAADLLGLPSAAGAALPAPPSALGIAQPVAGLLASGRRALEETHAAGGAVLLINQEPAMSPGGSATSGSVMTLRDQSVLQRLVGELDSVRTLSSTLRSQAHEHANTMHTVVSLLELGRVDAAVDLVTSATAASQSLADGLLRGGQDAQQALGALLLGKVAQAHERGVELRIRIDPGVVVPMPPAAIVSVAGNLIDNAIDAARRGPAPRWAEVELADEGGPVLHVRDSGPGVPDVERARVFEPGATSKPDAAGHGFGLAIVHDAVLAANGSVEIDADPPTTFTVRFPGAAG